MNMQQGVDLVLPSQESKSLLQRRGNVSSAMQAGIDGLSVIIITWALVSYELGAFATEYVQLLLVLMGMMAVIYDHLGVYRTNTKFAGHSLQLFKAWSLAFLGLFVLAFLTKQGDVYSRAIITKLFFLGYITQISLHSLVKSIQLGFIKGTQQLNNVVIVGQGRLANYLNAKISNNVWMGEKIVGAVGFESYATLNMDSSPVSNVPMLGGLGDLTRIIEQYEVKTVYIVTPLSSSGVIQDVYFKLLDKNVTVHWVPDIFSLRLVNHSFTEVAGVPVLTLSETPLVGFNKLAKEIEDFVLASIIFIMILPVLAIVALAVKLDSPGPVFFRQNRAGWNGKAFRIWKFRSMYVHQEGAVVKQAQKNDPRITRVGAFIRKTSLDELPQIFNVLTGDMSLVGPRPHALQHDEEYSKRISDYFARHHIKPGITGLAQVRGLRGETSDIDLMVQRIESDIEYINNWSVWLDLTILLRTLKSLTGKNAY